MFFIYECLIIIGYLFNGYLGFILMLAATVAVLFINKKMYQVEKILLLQIMALPCSFIGIMGLNTNHIMSWYNIFLLLFMLYATLPAKQNGWRINRHLFLAIMVIVVCMALNIITTSDVARELTEIVQVLLMIIPIATIVSNSQSMLIKNIRIDWLIEKYVEVCLAMSVGVVVQYFLRNFLGIEVGNFIYGASRVSYIVLFTGASIVPIFLGSAFTLILSRCLLEKIKVSDLIKICVLFVGMLIESSRSGLVAAFATFAIMYLSLGVKRFGMRMIVLAGIGIVGAFIMVDYISSNRVGLSNVFASNGRVETWIDGISIWTASVKNILIGEGFAGDRWLGVMKPHIFIIQSLAQCGVVWLVCFCYLIFSYWQHVKTIKEKYVILFFLIASNFITDCYANAFMTVSFILVYLKAQSKHLSQQKTDSVKGECE